MRDKTEVPLPGKGVADFNVLPYQIRYFDVPLL